MRALRQASDVIDLDYPLILIDRVEHAVSSSPQASQVRRSVRERLRWSRLISELAKTVPERSDTGGVIPEETRRLI
jgi:hypothetical protein